VDKYNLSNITTYGAGAAQASMHRALQKACDDILRPFGITKMQWLIIGAVLDSDSSGARISDLASGLGTTIPYLTNTINLLESKDILQRTDNDADSRSKLIKLNPAFKPRCAEIERTLRDGLRKSIYASVDPEEFKIYIKVLFQLKETGEKLNGR
jgi:DNA-binding MarR family transcriptional regulator